MDKKWKLVLVHTHFISIFQAEKWLSLIVLQKPKVLPYIEAMRKNIAFALSIDESQINVKATTEEKLGFTGREEGIAAHAVVLIEQKNKVPRNLWGTNQKAAAPAIKW